MTIIHFVRYAVVTGSNKGIGLETVRQLASKGVKVVLTARDEKKGLEAVQKLKDSGLSDLVIFHQLDVANPGSIASLADFIKTQFGRLDILVGILSLSLSLSLYIYIYIYIYSHWFDVFKANNNPAIPLCLCHLLTKNFMIYNVGYVKLSSVIINTEFFNSLLEH